MSDFFASLAERNLGPQPDAPAADGDSVRPRPAAAFEPDGAGLSQVPSEPFVDTAEPAEAEQLVVARRVLPVVPDMSEANGNGVSVDADGVNRTPAPSASILAPAPSDTEFLPEFDPAPGPEDVAVAEELVTQPLDTIPVLEPGIAPQPSSAREGHRNGDPVPPLLRPEVSGRPPNQSDQARAAPKSPADTAPDRPNKLQSETDAPLERIVRQMVLTPRPEPRQVDTRRDRKNSDAKTDPISAMDQADPVLEPLAGGTHRDPGPDRVASGLEPLARATHRDPGQDRAAPYTAPLHPSIAAEAQIQQLAPVPDSPAPTEPKATETTIRINIGRIEVHAGAAEPQTRENRPSRPAPTLMSLDDYLRTRGTGTRS